MGFSGCERVFGGYFDSIALNVIVEDNTEEQKKFWIPFFESAARENPDIDLKVYFQESPPCESEQADMAFGGQFFLSANGFPPGKSMRLSKLETCGRVPGEMEILRGQLAINGAECYQPYGFQQYSLITADNFPAPRKGENTLEYIERLAKSLKKQKLGYAINNASLLFASCGLKFIDPATGRFQMPDKDRFFDIFGRARKLYKDGHLIWLHGNSSNYETLHSFPPDQAVRITERIFNHQVGAAGQHTKVLPYPDGGNNPIYPVCAAISAFTPHPEECMRVISALLEPECQKLLFDCGIALPVHPLSMSRAGLRNGCCRNANIPLLNTSEYWRETVKVIAWEFFYFLNGRRGDEVHGLIREKIRFLEQARAEPRPQT
jgi:hypothetical protein